eukprot:6704496-Pyramimonas_sp.AAC.1
MKNLNLESGNPRKSWEPSRVGLGIPTGETDGTYYEEPEVLCPLRELVTSQARNLPRGSPTRNSNV